MIIIADWSQMAEKEKNCLGVWTMYKRNWHV